MKFVYTRRLRVRSLMLIAVAVVSLSGSAILTMAARSKASTTVTVINHSQRDIHHIYLAAGSPDNWGPDQLNGATLRSGSSYVVSGVSCSGTVRVIAEDRNGCFVYYTASCDVDQTWEITTGATPDCGGQ